MSAGAPTADLDLLHAAATALLGESWQRPLARILHRPGAERTGVNDRLVRRWVAGKARVPQWVLVELRERLETRADEIRALIMALPRD